MRRISRLIVAAAVLEFALAAGLTGCSFNASAGGWRQGTADNEVLSLEEIPEDKMLITMRVQDGINGNAIRNELMRAFPSVYIVMQVNTPDGIELEKKDFADLYLAADTLYFDQYGGEALVDLSAQDFLENYYLSALNDCAIDGKIYYLPGPSSITGIIYDREMFREHGWNVPGSFSEFIDLCNDISEEGIRPLQPSLYYNDSVKTFFSGFTYDAVFGGMENYKWLQEYRDGKGSMVGHMEPAFEIMEKLRAAGVWQPQDFEVRPVERTYMMYRDHGCAMIIETLYAQMYAKEYGGGQEHELGMMPFWSGDDEDSDYLFTQPNFYMAANKKLQEPDREKEYKMVLEMLKYLSTPQGQEAIISKEAPMIGSVKGMSMEEEGLAAEVSGTIIKGNLVPLPSYAQNGNSAVDAVMSKMLRLYGQGEATETEVMNGCDEALKNVLQKPQEEGVLLGQAERTFTVLETGLYLADVFRQKAEAQIGLCLVNTRRGGCNTKIYEGDIISSDAMASDRSMTCSYLQRSFQDIGRYDAPPRLLRVRMSGADICKALEEDYCRDEMYGNAFMAASGLRIEFAPWAQEGKRYASVTLEDGAQLQPDAFYTVAVWDGILEEELFNRVEAEYEESFLDIFGEAVQKAEVIKPFDDGRFLLSWPAKDS